MGHGDNTPPGQQAPYPPAAGAALGALPPPAGPYPAASPAAAAAAGSAAPYPPAQPGMTAPGGYPVMSPAGQHGAAGPSSGAPPSSSGYPPQPHPSAMEPPTKPHAMGPPPSGYPGAGAAPYPPPHGGPAPYPPPGGYPPQGATGPAPGYPVMGSPAAPVGGMYMEQGGVVDPGKEKCACSVGWVLFGVGFIFWPCWVAAAFVPLCTRNRNDRLAGIASTIGMLCLVILGIIIGVTSSSRRNW